ncbi:MAG: hypothetical protein GQ574_10920 [Crocinitomix sp.]|nr:hypothetical protein [Crocinitomix sp.]
MKKFCLILFLIPLIGFTQANYFVNDGNLEVMRTTPDDGYVGAGDNGKSLVKLNHDFELVWSIGEFKGAILDMVVNQETGLITVIHEHYDLCEVSRIQSDGTILDRQGFTFIANLEDADIELTSEGYAFGFNAFLDGDATQSSAIIGVTDNDLNFEWLKSFEVPEDYDLMEIDLEVYDDSIAFLATSYWDNPDSWEEINYSSFSRFTIDGDLIGTTLLGTECSHYVDFEKLNEGGFVVVGEMLIDEIEGIKISVLNHAGVVIATKQRKTAWSDSGWNRATVEVLSDDRYVVCNNYYEGHGSFNQGSFYLFDNHKAIKVWQFRPTPWVGEDTDDLDLWCIDKNDQMIFSGDVYDHEYGVYTNFTMGRMTWLSEGCGIGDYYNTWMHYGIDPTDTIVIDPVPMIPLTKVDILDPLDEWDYSNVFDCSNESADAGSVVEDDHLYGGAITGCITDQCKKLLLAINVFSFVDYEYRLTIYFKISFTRIFS